MDSFYFFSIILGIIMTMIIGGIYYYGDSLSKDSESEWSQVSLEEISCEIVAGKKSFLNSVDQPLGYNFDKIIYILNLKWEQMTCNDPSSEYWRGDNWKYVNPIENRIDQFNEKNSDYMDELYDKWEKQN